MSNANAKISNGSAPDNQNVPDKVKGHAHAVLDQDVGDDQSHKQKDLTSVTAGPKASVMKKTETAILMC